MKISYNNKQNINTNNSIPNENKVSANDMNNIKETVNTNYDEFEDLVATVNGNTSDIEDLDGRLDTAETDITNNENDITSLEDRMSSAENDIDDIQTNNYTKTEVNNLLSTKANTSDIPTNLNQLSNANTKFVNETQLSNAVGTETTNRENADNNLQSQIDSIVASSDVVDIVGTYQDLQNYDTSNLGDNDIIKVLDDNTHNNATSYYRWHNNIWNYIGSEGPYYTKAQTDNKFVEKITGKGLSINDFTNELKSKLEGIEANAEVNIIESVKVNNVTQTITNKSVNIPVPTSTSDLTNDSNFVTNTDYATSSVGGVFKTQSTYSTEVENGYLRCTPLTYANYQNAHDRTFIGKKTLDNVLNAVVGDIATLLDEINGENI